MTKVKITFSRWPNQGYGWFPHKNSNRATAPLNPSCARFGGGWKYKLGVSIGIRTIILDLIFGIIRIEFIKQDQQLR